MDGENTTLAIAVAGVLLGAGVIVGAGLVATRAAERAGAWLLARVDRVVAGAVERQRARRAQRTTWCVEEVQA